MHRDFWNYRGDRSGVQRQKGGFYSAERDKALLIALIFILMSDGGDEMLIMALLYILS